MDPLSPMSEMPPVIPDYLIFPSAVRLGRTGDRYLGNRPAELLDRDCPRWRAKNKLP